MLERNVSALFGLSDTDAVLAAAPPAAAAETLFLTSGATSPQLAEQIPTYLYLACFGDNDQAAAGAEYARQTLKAGASYVPRKTVSVVRVAGGRRQLAAQLVPSHVPSP